MPPEDPSGDDGSAGGDGCDDDRLQKGILTSVHSMYRSTKAT